MGIVILSVVGIVLEEVESKIIPINPTIIRVMRVLRIARVLKLLKMAKGIRALLDTVMQALPQVGNLGLLFFLLFFIFAALGVELFGRLGNHFDIFYMIIWIIENKFLTIIQFFYGHRQYHNLLHVFYNLRHSWDAAIQIFTKKITFLRKNNFSR